MEDIFVLLDFLPYCKRVMSFLALWVIPFLYLLIFLLFPSIFSCALSFRWKEKRIKEGFFIPFSFHPF